MTLHEATEMGNKLKQEYGFGTSKCPEWFRGIAIGLQQDSSYGLNICVPDLSIIPTEEREKFSDRINGFWIGFRVVKPMKYEAIQTTKTDVPKIDNKTSINDKVPIIKVEK